MAEEDEDLLVAPALVPLDTSIGTFNFSAWATQGAAYAERIRII